MEKELNITVDTQNHPLTKFVQDFTGFGRRMCDFEPRRQYLLQVPDAQLKKEGQAFVEELGSVIDEMGEWMEAQLGHFDDPTFFGSHGAQRLENGQTLEYLFQEYRDLAVRMQRNCGAVPEFNNQLTVNIDRALNKTKRQMKADSNQ